MPRSFVENMKEKIRAGNIGVPPFHLKRWKLYRLGILVAGDLIIVGAAYWLSFYLRLESLDFGKFDIVFSRTLPIFVITSIVFFLFGGMYRQVWRYANIHSAVLIGKLVLFSTIFSVGITYFLWPQGFPPRSVPVMFWLLTSVVITLQKFSWRAWANFKASQNLSMKKRCVIYGAGSAGELAARHIAANPNFPYFPVAFIDDDKNKQGRLLHGLKIMGAGVDLAAIAKKHNVSTAILAIHSAPGKVVRTVVEQCEAAGVEPLIMPEMANVLGKDIVQPRKIDIQDLLRRSPASVDDQLIAGLIEDKIILVTGAGGSIGSEICRQVVKYAPRKLLMVDFSEYNLFRIDLELREKLKDPRIELVPLLGSVTSSRFVNEVFTSQQPDTVLHAAAYKHVPMMEGNVREGIINNIVATKLLASAAAQSQTSKFLLVSSDKAVRPVNVMGASKRCCELIIQAFSQKYGDSTTFSSVRFGNVLGSSGSVVPRFIEQIQAGGPVTVTHPEITRFFMLIEEAVGLVLQSAAMASGGEIFVLNMGDPVKIYDMARHLITLSGKQPGKDIDIQISGLRPGEKLYEELILEGTEEHTVHRDVYIAKSAPIDSTGLLASVDELLKIAECKSTKICRKQIFALIGQQLPPDSFSEKSNEVVLVH